MGLFPKDAQRLLREPRFEVHEGNGQHSESSYWHCCEDRIHDVASTFELNQGLNGETSEYNCDYEVQDDCEHAMTPVPQQMLGLRVGLG